MLNKETDIRGTGYQEVVHLGCFFVSNLTIFSLTNRIRLGSKRLGFNDHSEASPDNKADR